MVDRPEVGCYFVGTETKPRLLYKYGECDVMIGDKQVTLEVYEDNHCVDPNLNEAPLQYPHLTAAIDKDAYAQIKDEFYRRYGKNAAKEFEYIKDAWRAFQQPAQKYWRNLYCTLVEEENVKPAEVERLLREEYDKILNAFRKTKVESEAVALTEAYELLDYHSPAYIAEQERRKQAELDEAKKKAAKLEKEKKLRELEEEKKAKTEAILEEEKKERAAEIYRKKVEAEALKDAELRKAASEGVKLGRAEAVAEAKKNAEEIVITEPTVRVRKVKSGKTGLIIGLIIAILLCLGLGTMLALQILKEQEIAEAPDGYVHIAVAVQDIKQGDTLTREMFEEQKVTESNFNSLSASVVIQSDGSTVTGSVVRWEDLDGSMGKFAAADIHSGSCLLSTQITSQKVVASKTYVDVQIGDQTVTVPIEDGALSGNTKIQIVALVTDASGKQITAIPLSEMTLENMTLKDIFDGAGESVLNEIAAAKVEVNEKQ